MKMYTCLESVKICRFNTCKQSVDLVCKLSVKLTLSNSSRQMINIYFITDALYQEMLLSYMFDGQNGKNLSFREFVKTLTRIYQV